MTTLVQSFPMYVATAMIWSPDRIAELIEQGEAAGLREAVLATGYEGQASRRTRVAWLQREQAEDWFRELDALTRLLNEQYWGLDLHGLTESLQYTVYEAGDHYGWHTDAGPKVRSRKLSVSVQLTDPAEYEGGELQIQMAEQLHVMPKEQGRAVVFPSFIRHRVTPVTRGVRRALVAWIGGPPFR